MPQLSPSCKDPLDPAALNHQTWKTLALLSFLSFPGQRSCYSFSLKEKTLRFENPALRRWKLTAASESGRDGPSENKPVYKAGGNGISPFLGLRIR